MQTCDILGNAVCKGARRTCSDESRKALSFVTELTLDELRSLHDFRVVMYQSVLFGAAKSERDRLFEHYDLGRGRRYISMTL
mgnify:CR=1 FL=1